CMTSLQLSNFIKLGAEDKVVGITSTRHLFNKTINNQLKEGKTAKIGIEGNFDNEVIMSINPDLILISPFKRGGYETMKDIGIPLIPHLGYKEMTPLGQAEWIKFVGLLLGIEQEANEKFSAIENRY
ncbi:MAG TPA: iron ABC transporter substrate-binding protein, partial [Parabacteroides goldsteinii]|nr:iron ABC transporter substrate-binding protein [Parabacteroides goldsteinii]